MGSSQISALKNLTSYIKSETEFILNKLESKITLSLKLDIPDYYVIENLE